MKYFRSGHEYTLLKQPILFPKTCYAFSKFKNNRFELEVFLHDFCFDLNVKNSMEMNLCLEN